MRGIISRIGLLAKRRLAILITGERGVGKELIARMIHSASPRAGNHFRAINCGAISPQHIASELFGVEAGAFSDVKKRLGAIRAADGGTLFLDEVGDLSLEAQASLLRALEYQEITPLGSDKVAQTDVRFIFGTNKDLQCAIARGEFRADFYDRIAAVEIEIPPLRARPEDIDALIDHYACLEDMCTEEGVANFSSQTRQALRTYPWPGNVRELKNVIAELATLESKSPVQLECLPQKILDACLKDPKKKSATDREVYRRLLEAHNGNVAQVARSLNEKYTTVRSRLKKFRLL